MKLKIIIFLAIILTSCETTNKKVITNKDFKNYSNDGFALIFNNDIFKIYIRYLIIYIFN